LGVHAEFAEMCEIQATPFILSPSERMLKDAQSVAKQKI